MKRPTVASDDPWGKFHKSFATGYNLQLPKNWLLVYEFALHGDLKKCAESSKQMQLESGTQNRRPQKMQTNQTNLQGHAPEKLPEHAKQCNMEMLIARIDNLHVHFMWCSHIKFSRTGSRAYHIILSITKFSIYSYFLHFLRSGIIGTSHIFSPLRRRYCTTLCHQEGEGRKFFQQAIKGALDKYGLVVTLRHVWAPTLGGFMCPKRVFFWGFVEALFEFYHLSKWHKLFYCEYGPLESDLLWRRSLHILV